MTNYFIANLVTKISKILPVPDICLQGCLKSKSISSTLLYVRVRRLGLLFLVQSFYHLHHHYCFHTQMSNQFKCSNNITSSKSTYSNRPILIVPLSPCPNLLGFPCQKILVTINSWVHILTFSIHISCRTIHLTWGITMPCPKRKTRLLFLWIELVS